jgi:NAD(P)-dependent dehydrogenase (short-subunit alcohol dehydrogenase family)
MPKVAVITGAGSGVGRAIAIQLAAEGWNLALVGRRVETLEETARLAGLTASRFLCCSADIARAADVDRMAAEIDARWPDVEVLVNAAGTNTPQRSLEVLSREKYHEIIDTNLDGAYFCVQAFLPGMRRRRSGTIINIVSDAGRQASPKAGPAYAASKFALLGLNQSINAEERGNGIRACAILPGDIDTPILDKRPAPPTAEAREKMLKSEDIAACAMLAINLPCRAIIEELLIRPR